MVEGPARRPVPLGAQASSSVICFRMQGHGVVDCADTMT